MSKNSQHSAVALSRPAAADIPVALRHFDVLPDSAQVGSDVVRALFGGVTGPATLWRWVKAGKIPAPRKLPGSRLNLWRVGDLRAALNAGA
jgi:hypothetical protein